jgi:hypothetical protein
MTVPEMKVLGHQLTRSVRSSHWRESPKLADPTSGGGGGDGSHFVGERSTTALCAVDKVEPGWTERRFESFPRRRTTKTLTLPRSGSRVRIPSSALNGLDPIRWNTSDRRRRKGSGGVVEVATTRGRSISSYLVTRSPVVGGEFRAPYVGLVRKRSLHLLAYELPAMRSGSLRAEQMLAHSGGDGLLPADSREWLAGTDSEDGDDNTFGHPSDQGHRTVSLVRCLHRFVS